MQGSISIPSLLLPGSLVTALYLFECCCSCSCYRYWCLCRLFVAVFASAGGETYPSWVNCYLYFYSVLCSRERERERGDGGRAVLCLPHSHFVQFCLQLSSERTFCIKRVNNIPIVEVWICCCLLGHTIVWLVPNCLLGNSHVFKYVKTIRFFPLSFQKMPKYETLLWLPGMWMNVCVCVSVYKCKTHTHTLKEKSCKSYINHSLRWGNGCATFLLFLFRFPLPCIQRSRDWPNVYYTDRQKITSVKILSGKPTYICFLLELNVLIIETPL